MSQPLLLTLPRLLPYVAVLRLIPRKTDLADAPEARGRLIRIIIPARNESGCSATRIPPLHGLAYPPGSASALYIALKSAWKGDTGVKWKGRTYSGLSDRARRGAATPASREE